MAFSPKTFPSFPQWLTKLLMTRRGAHGPLHLGGKGASGLWCPWGRPSAVRMFYPSQALGWATGTGVLMTAAARGPGLKGAGPLGPGRPGSEGDCSSVHSIVEIRYVL